MLPSKEDMMVEIKTFYDTLEAQGIPKRYTHYLGLSQVRNSVTSVSAVRPKPIQQCTIFSVFACTFWQFEYFDWLASQCGCSGTEKWRKEMCLTSFMRVMKHPETYRDEWEDHHLVSQAYQDF